MKKNPLKKLFAFCLALIMVLSLAACGSKEESEEKQEEEITETATEAEREYKTKVAVLDGPTGIGLSKLKVDRSYAYDVEYYSDPQAIIPTIISGETDIACLPLNLAANLYKKTNGGIKMLAINCLGVLHILEKGNTIKDIKDLKGKTIYSTGKGSTPEFILNYVLTQNGINPETDVKIEYLSVHSELAAKAISGDIDICMLPEPFASKVLNANTEMTEALDLTAEWNKISSAPLAMGCIIARNAYIGEHPDLLTEFMEYSELSVNFIAGANGNIKFLMENGYFDNFNVAESAVAGCNLIFIDGKEMKETANANFKVLFDADPASVGGAIPDDGLYYVQ